MTEKKKTYRGATLSLVLASVAICALVCGCTTTGEISENTTLQSDTQRSSLGNGTAGGGFDLASVAAELGVTEEALEAALGSGADGGQMDFEAAAEELGVTVEELQTALRGPFGGQMSQDGQTPPNGTPPATPSR